MSIQIRPSRARAMNGQSALAGIENALAQAGAKMPNYREIRNARKIIETERALAAEFHSLTSATGARAHDALADLVIDGQLTVGQAIVAAAEAEASRGKSAQALRSAADRKTAGRVVDELAKVGDRWVTDVFRPLVTEIVRELEGMTDLVQKCNPRGPSKAHDNRETRDRFTRANDLAQDLEAIHREADRLRNMAIIPASNRDFSAEYRWANLDRLGTLDTSALAILVNIANGAGAGIYTEAETVRHVEQAEARKAEQRRTTPRLFVGPGVTV